MADNTTYRTCGIDILTGELGLERSTDSKAEGSARDARLSIQLMHASISNLLAYACSSDCGGAKLH